MPSALSPNPRAGSAQPDDLDRLLDFDNAVQDFMNDIPSRDGQNNTVIREQPPQDEDQEVQVKKKRQPVPKLDENRLLSDAGIPKLRKITKSRLKFRGKGHEFTDITHILNTYQLWLDDLYPRAKFRDALTMVEKVGHSKRMQVTRRAWLDDTKPSRRELTPPTDAVGNPGAMDENHSGRGSPPSGTSPRSAENAARHDDSLEQSQDDELDALLAESGQPSATSRHGSSVQQPRTFELGEPDEGEFDALLADDTAPETDQNIGKLLQEGLLDEEPDDDELDALLAEENSMSQRPASINSTARKQTMDDFADDEEAMDDMWA